MIEQRVDCGFTAVNQIHYAFGQARLFEKLVYVAHGERDALRGLQDEGIAGSDGVGQIPERNHAGKIERRDRRYYA